MRAARLFRDADAHAAGGAFDEALGGFDTVDVEVFHLRLGDAVQLRFGDRGDLGLVRCGAALLDFRLFA